MPADRHARYDPELVPALVKLEQLYGSLSWGPERIAELRRIEDGFAPTDDALRRDGAVAVSERVIAGPASELRAIVLSARDAGPRAPAVYSVHGGGTFMGNHRSDTEQVAEWVERFGAVAVSVDYRLAPEHPHPAPVEDCYAGLVWLAEHADELGVDPGRIVVAGLSAGGGLSAAVALLARDRGGPPLLGQLLMCAMLDDRNETPSSYELQGEGLWDRTSNLTGWSSLLGAARGGPDVPVYAAPARATDLSGLPPAFIDVGSADVLRDEDVDYAVRIWQAGGSAELHVWPGGYHAFDQFEPDARLTRAAKTARVDWLAERFGG